MDLHLQFGFGMKEHCHQLLRAWQGGTVILSPRDRARDKLEVDALDFTGLPGGEVLLDPQFYLPRSDHKRLTDHDYWPRDYETNGFFSGPGMVQMMASVLDLNKSLGCAAFILPGLLADTIDDTWLTTLRSTAEYSLTMGASVPIFATVALSSDAMREPSGIQDVLAEFEQLGVDGAYLVLEHPSYIVDDPVWLTNAIELVAGLRLLGKKVIVGYANHALLYLAAASADAIASGTWMNVRSFARTRFLAPEQNMKNRGIWFYHPESLSEYQLTFLDRAHHAGLLPSMAPSIASEPAKLLFAGVQPTSAGFGESEAFRHYLLCLREQARTAHGSTFDATLANIRGTLDAAERRARELAEAGVLPQGRGFTMAFDAIRSALLALESTRGPVLRRSWPTL